MLCAKRTFVNIEINIEIKINGKKKRCTFNIKSLKYCLKITENHFILKIMKKKVDLSNTFNTLAKKS
jgi:hypothetical protein